MSSSSFLVTGAAGFIGFHLCEALLAEGHYVLGIDNINSYYDTQLKHDRLARLREHAGFMFVRMDLSDRNAVESLFFNSTFDGIFHFAAQAGVRYSLENPYAYVDSNLVSFVNVLECCRRNQVNHFIYASSSSVYGNNSKLPFDVSDPVEQPLSLYAATKRSNELLAFTYSHLYGLHTTGLRFFTVYGPWGRPDMAVYRFTRSILAGEPIDVFNHGRMRRDFTYIDDVVYGILQALRSSERIPDGERMSAPSRLYNLGNSQPVDLMEMIRLLEESLGVSAQVRFHGIQPGDLQETYADISASERDLDFRPRTTLREGLKRFVEWYRDYHGKRTSRNGSRGPKAGHRKAWEGFQPLG